MFWFPLTTGGISNAEDFKSNKCNKLKKVLLFFFVVRRINAKIENFFSQAGRRREILRRSGTSLVPFMVLQRVVRTQNVLGENMQVIYSYLREM